MHGFCTNNQDGNETERRELTAFEPALAFAEMKLAERNQLGVQEKEQKTNAIAAIGAPMAPAALVPIRALQTYTAVSMEDRKNYQVDTPFLSQLQGAFFALLAREASCSDVRWYSCEYLHTAG